MSLVFADSFDHYATGTGDLQRKWGAGGGAGVVPGGRRGTRALSGNAQREIGDQTEVIVGAAFFIEGGESLLGVGIGGESPSGNVLWEFLNDDVTYLRLGVSTDGRLRVTRGRYPQVLTSESPSTGATALATTTAGTVPFFSWVYIELRALFAYEGGAVEVRVNGEPVIELPSVQTIPSNRSDEVVESPPINPEYITQFALYAARGLVDDVYVLNADGDRNNDFLGDLQVDVLKPSGAGLRDDSTIIGTSPDPTRWEANREADGAVSAVQLNAEGESDSYEFDDLPYGDAVVHAVQVTTQARKADSGHARVTLTNDLNDEAVDALPVQLAPSAGDDYAFKSAMLDESADGPWTLERVNDSEFGLRRDAA
jgi:hypothetical protein